MAQLNPEFWCPEWLLGAWSVIRNTRVTRAYRQKRNEIKMRWQLTSLENKFSMTWTNITNTHINPPALLFQICCHPGLIKTMIDSEARVNGGLEDSQSVEEDDDLINQMSGMAIGAGGKSQQSSQVWHLTQFFLFPLFVRNLWFAGKSLTSHQGITLSSVPPSSSLVSVLVL